MIRQRILDAGGRECDGCGELRLPGKIRPMSDRQLVHGEWVHRALYYCIDQAGCGKAVAAKLDDLCRQALNEEHERTHE